MQHTIDALNGTAERISADNVTEQEDHQSVLKALSQKMALIDRKIDDLHAEAMDAVTGR